MRERRTLLTVLALAASLWAARSADAQPLQFQQQLIGPSGQSGSVFGFSVAVDGATAVVGARSEDVGTNDGQGAAYVFVRTGNTWTQQQRLLASDGATGDAFGHAVAISGTTIVVGASLAERSTQASEGAAYVFTWNGAAWVEQARLSASDAGPTDVFGSDVAIDGNTVIVGAHEADRSSLANVGAAYVFERTGTTWVEHKLVSADGAAGDNFGWTVDVSGSSVCVGAFSKDLAGGTNHGAVYVFARSGASWGLQQQILAADGSPGDSFGASCAIDGDTMVTGAYGDDTPISNQGSAYVFVRSGTTWTLQQHLLASDGTQSDSFGRKVDIRADRIAVGAPFDETKGSVYLFARSGSAWTQVDKVRNDPGQVNDNFGGALGLDAATLFVGAPNIGGTAGAPPGSAFVFGIAGGSQTGAPGAPTNFQAAASGNTLNLSWATPASGGAPTGYTLVGRTPSGQLLATVPLGNVTSLSVAGPNGVFALSVRASNAAGTGPESNVVTVTLPSATPPPGNPTNLVVTVAGNSAAFSWGAPGSGGPATGYLLAAGTSPGFTVPLAVVPLPATARSFSVPGIPAGTFYVRVFAQNAGGISGPSNEVKLSVAGGLVPGAPTLNTPAVAGHTVGLSWTPGGGGTPTSYVIAAASSPGAAPFATASVHGTSISIPGVPSGTYYLRLVAVNGAGMSPTSNEVTLVVP